MAGVRRDRGKVNVFAVFRKPMLTFLRPVRGRNPCSNPGCGIKGENTGFGLEKADNRANLFVPNRGTGMSSVV